MLSSEKPAIGEMRSGDCVIHTDIITNINKKESIINILLITLAPNSSLFWRFFSLLFWFFLSPNKLLSFLLHPVPKAICPLDKLNGMGLYMV